MKKIKLKIDGIQDNKAKDNLINKLKEKSGIKNVEFNIPKKILSITYDKINKSKLENYLDDLDIKSEGEVEELFKKEEVNLINHFLLGILLIILLLYSTIKVFNIDFLKIIYLPKIYSISYLVLIIPFLLYGIDIIINGFINITKLRINKYSLGLIMILTSISFSIYSTIMIYKGYTAYVNNIILEPILLLIYFIKTEQILLIKNKNKVKENIKTMSLNLPTEATLKVNDDFKIINSDEVKEEDILITNPGERFVCDGVLTSSTTVVDETYLTGNSILTSKKVNDYVLAGTLNYDSKVEYKVDKTLNETALSNIINQKTKDKSNKGILNKAFIYNILIFIVFIIIRLLIKQSSILTTKVIIEEIIKTLIILLPPTLIISITIPLLMSIKLLSKKNILVKESKKLEYLKDINTIVIDKTGTLTNGVITISKLINTSSKFTDKEIVNIIGSMAKSIDHPISIGIKRYLKQERVKPTYKLTSEYLANYGIKSKDIDDIYYLCNKELIEKLDIINSYKEEENKLKQDNNLVLYLVRNNKIIAVVGFKDSIRTNAKELISKLNKKKYNVIMLSGDNQVITTEIANELKIKEAYANMTPTLKQEFIKKLQANGKKVLMLGDGINDIPALKEADFSVTIETTMNLTSKVSNIIIKKDDIIKLLDILKLGKKYKNIIKQNIFYVILLNILLNINNINTLSILLTFFISTIVILINSLRIRR